MSIFSFFKKKPGTVKATYNGTTFEAPKPMSNEEYQEMRRQEVEHLEAKYDLKTVHGINSIPVPRVKERPSGGISNVTGKIEYYLTIKGNGFKKAGETELALACYRKANQLMSFSSTAYPREAYMKLPNYLKKLQRFDEADTEEEKINSLFRYTAWISNPTFPDSSILSKRNKPQAEAQGMEVIRCRQPVKKKPRTVEHFMRLLYAAVAINPP